MLKSKNPIIRTSAYIVIGFFTILIGWAFVMPDFKCNPSLGNNSAAVVNKKNIPFIQVSRFIEMSVKPRMGEGFEVTNAVQQRVVDILVNREIQIQFAAENGIAASDEAAKSLIRKMFSDKNNNFNDDGFKRYLDHNRISMVEYYELMKNDIALNELGFLIESGCGISPEEVDFAGKIKNSSLQIKYAFISAQDLNTAFKDRLAVTEEEVTAEMKANSSELKDPDTDRARFRAMLSMKKLDAVKAELVKAADDVASRGGKFEEAAAAIKGKVSQSAVFKIGDPIFDEKNKQAALETIMNSKTYADAIMTLETGKSSKAISARDGIYVFTPVKREIKDADPAAKDSIAKQLAGDNVRTAYNALLTPYVNAARVIKTDRFNAKD